MPGICFRKTSERREAWGVPGGLVVRIQSFHCHSTGLISASETEIP